MNLYIASEVVDISNSLVGALFVCIDNAWISIVTNITDFISILLSQVSNYSKELEEMKHVTKQEFIASLRRFVS